MQVRVVAAAIVDAGRVFAARRAPGMTRAGLWELPGGKVEPGETDAEALAREVAEELGLRVEVGAFLAEADHAYADVRVVLAAYACRIVSGTPTLHEHDAMRWLGPDELDRVTWAPADVPLLAAVERVLRR